MLERVHGEGLRIILVLGFPSKVSRVIAVYSTWLYLTSSRIDTYLSHCVEVGSFSVILSGWVSVNVSQTYPYSTSHL